MIQMCLAVPPKMLEANGDVGKVDFGQGIFLELNAMLVETWKGEYVFVRSGCVIQAIDGEAAEENLRLWDEISKFEKSTP